jgi:hypothetical protein
MDSFSIIIVAIIAGSLFSITYALSTISSLLEDIREELEKIRKGKKEEAGD